MNLKQLLIAAAAFFAIGCGKKNDTGGNNSARQAYAVDETFNSPDNLNGFNLGIKQPDGKIIAAGSGSFMRFNTNGSVDASFKPPAAMSSGEIYAIAPQADGKTLVSGNFTVGSHISIARLNADGSLDNNFRLTGIASPKPSIYNILIQPDGGIIISGAFDLLQGGALVSGIARLSGSGAADARFSGLKFSSSGRRISRSLLLSDGKIMIAGNFSIGSGSALRRVIARLNSDGTPDLGFNYISRLWTSNIPGIPGTIFAMKGDNNGKLLIGGDFNRKNGNADGSAGTSACNGLLQLNMDGSEAASFASPAKGRGIVKSILPLGTDKILVGRLTDLNATAGLLEYLTLLTADGADKDFALTAFVTGDAWELLPGPDNTVYMIGSFTKGQSSYKSLVRLKPQ